MPPRVRAIPKTRYEMYWHRATEFCEAANDQLAQDRFSVATLAAVHAAISALDALSVYSLGQRSADQDHREAVVLLSQLRDPSVADQSRRFLSLLDLRRRAAYEDRPVTSREARDAVASAVRLVEWVRSLLPRGSSP